MPSRLRLRLAALHGLRADLAAFFLGALAAAALPPFHVLPVLLVSVPGLLALLDAAPSVWVAARRGWWFGLGHHVLGLYWITEAILFEAGRFWWLVPLAVPAVAAVLALFIAVACFLARLATRGWPRVVALAGAWVLTDLARQFVLTGFPWNLWGSVWEIPGPVGDVLIQPAALVGVHGLTMATVFLAALPTLGRRWWLAGGAMLAAWAAFGVVRLQEAVAPQPLTVVLEQGNVAQGQKFDRALASRIFQHYVDLSSQGGQPRAAVDVWPETAFPGLLDLDERARQIIEQVNGGTPSLIGSIRFGQDRRPRNSLFAVVDKGAVAGVYDKWHLVPFGEYIPDWLPLPIIVLPGEGFAPGPGPRTLHVPGLPPVGPLICYEAIFSAEIVDRDRPAGMAGEHHQRCLVRQLHRSAPASGCRSHARRRGGPALAARSEHRDFGGVRCTWSRTWPNWHADEWLTFGETARRAAADALCAVWSLGARDGRICCTRNWLGGAKDYVARSINPPFG